MGGQDKTMTGDVILRVEHLTMRFGGLLAINDLSFDVRFESGKGYYLIIAGRCEAKAGSGREATVDVSVHDVSLDIDWKPAATAATGSTPAAPKTRPATTP